MEKRWELKKKIGDSELVGYGGRSRVEAQLLFNRGLKDEKEIECFFRAGPSEEDSPFLFRQMNEATEIVIRHIRAKNKIAVYGDYDADGVTAAALLYEFLRIVKADMEFFIPNRITEGYGLNFRAIDEIVRLGAKLIITVDTGIRNREEVEYAKSSGLEVIVTDHHSSPEDKDKWPDCPVINPVAPGENYPFRKLAGVGVAFKFAEALVEKSKLEAEIKTKLKEKLYDLAAIGTIADCVPLSGENRSLVRLGLSRVNLARRTGLNELIKSAGLEGKEIKSWNIAFQIAPRLNAAGRMEHANTAFELLVTENREEAEILAKKLNESNYERQRITEEMTDEIKKSYAPVEGDKLIFAVSPALGGREGAKWNEGVVGLAAGRICEEYYLPCLVITDAEEGDLAKGSARSVPEFNVIAAVEECAELLDKFGGHPMACGFALKKDNLDAFREKISAIARRELVGARLAPKITIETEIGLSEADFDLFETVEKFAPFGEDNEEPVFLSRGVLIVDSMMMGMENQHLKLKIRDERSAFKTALAFGGAEKWGSLKIGEKIDIVYTVDLNRFNGREEIQLKIVDLKKSENI